MDFGKLKEPFSPDDIEFRVQRAGAKGDRPWAMVLAYVTNRAIMNRLDDVCGPENWKNEFSTGPDGGVLCGISIRIGDEWVTKYDGADKTQVEAVKGGLSGAMKRAAVQWGIGRYLYGLDATFAEISSKGKHRQPGDKGGKYPAFKWNPPKLPVWALPSGAAPVQPQATRPPEPTFEEKFKDIAGQNLTDFIITKSESAKTSEAAVKKSAVKFPEKFRDSYNKWMADQAKESEAA